MTSTMTTLRLWSWHCDARRPWQGHESQTHLSGFTFSLNLQYFTMSFKIYPSLHLREWTLTKTVAVAINILDSVYIHITCRAKNREWSLTYFTMSIISIIFQHTLLSGCVIPRTQESPNFRFHFATTPTLLPHTVVHLYEMKTDDINHIRLWSLYLLFIVTSISHTSCAWARDTDRAMMIS